jgi:hypothetical protein
LAAGIGHYTHLLTIPNLVGLLVVGLLALWAVNAASLAIDFMRPMLSWDHPRQVIHRNLNGVLGVLVGAAGAGVVFLGERFVLHVVPGAQSLLLPLLGLLFGLLAIGLTRLCFAMAERYQ